MNYVKREVYKSVIIHKQIQRSAITKSVPWGKEAENGNNKLTHGRNPRENPGILQRVIEDKPAGILEKSLEKNMSTQSRK